jgi:hypothetical protein
MVETLFDLPKLFSKDSPFSHVFIPLINTDDIKIPRNKVDILFIIDRLHCDMHYTKTLTPIDLSSPRLSKSTGLFTLSFNYFMFDHNYPESNMLLVHDDYMSKPGGILQNVDIVIDHHLPINQAWLDTIPFTRVLMSGSGHTLLWEHYFHIWSTDNVSALANLFLAKQGIMDPHDTLQEEGEDYDATLPGDGVSDQECYVKRLMVASAFVIYNDSHSFNKVEKSSRWWGLDKDLCTRLQRNKKVWKKLFSVWMTQYEVMKYSVEKIWGDKAFFYNRLVEDYKQFRHNDNSMLVGKLFMETV